MLVIYFIHSRARLYIGSEGLKSISYNNAIKGESLSSAVGTWITTKGTYWFEHLNSTSAADPICSNDFYDDYGNGSSNSGFRTLAVVTIVVGSAVFCIIIASLLYQIKHLKGLIENKPLAKNQF